MADFNLSELKELQREFGYREFARQADVARSVAAQSNVPSIYQKTDEELWKNSDLNKKIHASLDALEFSLKNKDIHLDTYTDLKAETGRVIFSKGWKEAATYAHDQITAIKLFIANRDPEEIVDSLNKHSLYLARNTEESNSVHGQKIMAEIGEALHKNEKFREFAREAMPSHSNPIRLDKWNLATPLSNNRLYQSSSILMMMEAVRLSMDELYEPDSKMFTGSRGAEFTRNNGTGINIKGIDYGRELEM